MNIFKENLALNNLQGLICHKTNHPTIHKKIFFQILKEFLEKELKYFFLGFLKKMNKLWD